MRVPLLSRLCALTCGLFLLSSCGKEENAPDTRLHSSVETSVLLPARDTNVRYGMITSSKDGVRISAVIDYANGYWEDIRFHPNEMIKERRLYFPKSESLRSRSTFGEDGRTYTSHEVYDRSGKLEKTGKLRPDGQYETTYYHVAGGTPSRRRVFVLGRGYRAMLSEQVFERGGNVKASIQYLTDGKKSIVFYHPDGKMSAVLESDPVEQQGKAFANDGQTVLLTFRQDPWSLLHEFFNPSGEKIQSRIFQAGLLNISFRSADRSRVYTQSWRQGILSSFGVPTLLRKIWERDATTQELLRTGVMSKDGRYVQFVQRIIDGVGEVVEELDVQGNVISVTRPGRDEKLDPSKLGIQKEFFPEEVLKEPSVPIAIPNLTDTNVPRVVYDEPSDKDLNWKP